MKTREEINKSLEEYAARKEEFKKLKADLLDPITKIGVSNVKEGWRTLSWTINFSTNPISIKFNYFGKDQLESFTLETVKEMLEMLEFAEENKELYDEEFLKEIRGTY